MKFELNESANKVSSNIFLSFIFYVLKGKQNRKESFEWGCLGMGDVVGKNRKYFQSKIWWNFGVIFYDHHWFNIYFIFILWQKCGKVRIQLLLRFVHEFNNYTFNAKNIILIQNLAGKHIQAFCCKLRTHEQIELSIPTTMKPRRHAIVFSFKLRTH